MTVEIADRGTAYVRYLHDRPIARTIHVGSEASGVVADLNDFGNVIGIEIIDFSSSDLVDAARSYASDRGLPFPRDLARAAEFALDLTPRAAG